MHLGFRIVLVGVIMVGLALGAGAAAYQSSSSQAKEPVAVASGPAVAAADSGSNPAATQFMSGQSSQPSGGRPATGVVEKVGEREFTLKAEGGSTAVTVRVNDQTAIRKQVAVTLADIKPGERIIVQGEVAADETIAAATIQLSAASSDGLQMLGAQQGQARGGQTQPGAKPGRSESAQGGSGPIAGTVEEVANNVISIARAGGASTQNTRAKVSVSDKTTITKIAAGDMKDIKEGLSVIAIGPRGADGVIVASSVQIVPAEASSTMIRRQ